MLPGKFLWYVGVAAIVGAVTAAALAANAPSGSRPANGEIEHEVRVPNRHATSGSCGVERWAVKTGADVSRGRQWCYDASQAIIASKRAVPALLVGRLAASRRDKANALLTSDHWLDRLHSAVKTHIETFRGQRSELAERAMPPAQLFDHAFNSDEREWLDTGAALNSLYRTIRGKRLHGKRTGERLDDADMDAIRSAIDQYLSRFDVRDQSAILRGALVTASLSDESSDAALWLIGAKTEHGHAPGMAQKTMRALREVGLLDEIGVAAEGSVIRYPGAIVSEPTFERSIGLNAVWFHGLRRQRAAKGESFPMQPGDIPKAEANAAKAQIGEWARTRLQDYPITIQHTSYVNKKGKTVEQLGAFNDSGDLIGLVTQDSEAVLSEGQRITLKYAIAADGNVRAVWQQTEQDHGE